MEAFILGGLAGMLAELRRWIKIIESSNRNTKQGSRIEYVLTILKVIYSITVIISGSLLGGFAVLMIDGLKPGLSAFLIGACPTFLVSIGPTIVSRVMSLNESMPTTLKSTPSQNCRIKMEKHFIEQEKLRQDDSSVIFVSPQPGFFEALFL